MKKRTRRPPRTDRWQSLVFAADHILATAEAADDRAWATALEQLRSLKEIFGASLDPVDEFEAYAVRQFLKALEPLVYEQALAAQNTAERSAD